MAWGFLRETKELALKDGIDREHKLERTGLEEYLAVIFPHVGDWIHDKCVPGLSNPRIRPDYRSEELKLIVEYDGILHYQKLETISKDIMKGEIYRKAGYKVVRIPYFIQLTNEAVFKFFGVSVEEQLFNPEIPSFDVMEGTSTPAYCCPLGFKRMVEYFVVFREQYDVNIKYLEGINNELITGAELLKTAFEIQKTKNSRDFMFLKDFETVN